MKKLDIYNNKKVMTSYLDNGDCIYDEKIMDTSNWAIINDSNNQKNDNYLGILVNDNYVIGTFEIQKTDDINEWTLYGFYVTEMFRLHKYGNFLIDYIVTKLVKKGGKIKVQVCVNYSKDIIRTNKFFKKRGC